MTPLVAWCLCFCLGIVVASHFEILHLWLFGAVGLFSILCLAFLRIRQLCQPLLFGIAFLLGALTLANSKILSSGSIAHLTPSEKQTVVLKGVIISDPAVSNNKTSFILEASELSCGELSCKVCSRVLVRGKISTDFANGDEIIIQGSLYKPFDFPSNRKASYADFLKSQGIYSILSFKDKKDLKLIERRRSPAVKLFIVSLRQKLKKIISSSLTPQPASILDAMVLGEKDKAPRFLKDTMAKTGTWHILVVSGFHVGCIAYVILIALKILRIPRKTRFCLMIGLLVVYCLLVGSSAPVVRATVMVIAVLIGYLIDRKPLFYNSLALAALVILSVSPMQLFQIGFQLSFASVFFIVWLFPKMKRLFPERLIKQPLSCNVINSFCVAMSAWVGTAPLIAYVFGTFSPVTVLANMMVIPIAMFVVAGGFALLAIGTIWIPLAYPIAKATEFLIFLFLKANLFWSKLPFASLGVPQLPIAFVFGYYLLIFVFFNLIPKEKRV